MSLHQNICSRNQPCPVLDSPSLMWGGSCGIGRVARDPECSTAPSPAPQTPLSHPDSPECHCPHLQPGKGLCSPGALTQRVQGEGEMWGSARLGAQPPLGHSRVRALSFPSSVCSGRHRWSWMVGGAVAPLLGFLSAAFSSNSSPQAGAAVPLSGSAVQPWHPRVNQVVQEQNQRCRIRGTSISQPSIPGTNPSGLCEQEGNRTGRNLQPHLLELGAFIIPYHPQPSWPCRAAWQLPLGSGMRHHPQKHPGSSGVPWPNLPGGDKAWQPSSKNRIFNECNMWPGNLLAIILH